MIETGIYRLTKDVDNPNVDRRCRHDWHLMNWKEGMRFVVKDRGGDRPARVIYAGKWNHLALPVDKVPAELLAALERSTRPDDLVSEAICSAGGDGLVMDRQVLIELLDMGVLTTDAIRDAAKRYIERGRAK
jgi:hypothetical protein